MNQHRPIRNLHVEEPLPGPHARSFDSARNIGQAKQQGGDAMMRKIRSEMFPWRKAKLQDKEAW